MIFKTYLPNFKSKFTQKTKINLSAKQHLQPLLIGYSHCHNSVINIEPHFPSKINENILL